MSTPYPPNAPKKLLRSKSNRMLGGVCAGVAAYLNMDPTLVRVLTVVISLFTGIPLVLYIVALFVVPEEGAEPTAGFTSAPPPPASTTPPVAEPSPEPEPAPSTPAPSAPADSATNPDDTVWGSEGAPWEQRPAEDTGAPTTHAHEEDGVDSIPEPEEPTAEPEPAEPTPADPESDKPAS